MYLQHHTRARDTMSNKHPSTARYPAQHCTHHVHSGKRVTEEGSALGARVASAEVPTRALRTHERAILVAGGAHKLWPLVRVASGRRLRCHAEARARQNGHGRLSRRRVVHAKRRVAAGEVAAKARAGRWALDTLPMAAVEPRVALAVVPVGVFPRYFHGHVAESANDEGTRQVEVVDLHCRDRRELQEVGQKLVGRSLHCCAVHCERVQVRELAVRLGDGAVNQRVVVGAKHGQRHGRERLVEGLRRAETCGPVRQDCQAPQPRQHRAQLCKVGCQHRQCAGQIVGVHVQQAEPSERYKRVGQRPVKVILRDVQLTQLRAANAGIVAVQFAGKERGKEAAQRAIELIVAHVNALDTAKV